MKTPTQKILILSYYWPPAGGSGVQRWMYFAKYLKKMGWEPIVVTVDEQEASYAVWDKSLLEEVSEIRVIKTTTREPLRWYSLMTTGSMRNGIPQGEVKRKNILGKISAYIRGNFFIPDARKGWVPFAEKAAQKVLNEESVSHLVTTGPPHSTHLAGLQLKTQFEINWWVDFRDPWTDISYHKNLNLTQKAQQKHLQLEHKVLNISDHIIVTSSQTKQLFSKKTQQPISVVTNGFDDEIVPSTSLDSNFTITHIGSLFDQRNPILFWDVLLELIDEFPDFKANFQLVLVGNVSSEIRRSIESAGLKPYLKLVGSVSHYEAITYQIKTQVLLLIEANTPEASYIIPGKLFEYLNANRPIVALGPEQSDIPSILKDTHTGRYFDYDNKTALKTHILELFEGYKTNSLSVSSKDIERFSRKNCTKQLAEVLYSK